MKTWRVSLTYRVKSAHKVKLTDKQLLQWMVPILLVMGIYLGTWTAAEPPTATEVISFCARFLSIDSKFILRTPQTRSRISKDYFSNSAAIIGGIMQWLSGKFCFFYGAFVFATMFETLSRSTTRPNWFHTQSTTSLSSICWWWQSSEYTLISSGRDLLFRWQRFEWEFRPRESS